MMGDSIADGFSVGGLKLKKDTSVAEWDGMKGLAEVTTKKGKLWCSMGVMRGSKLYCNVEEAVYLVESGSLALLRDGKVMSTEEVYNLLLTPTHGCSWTAYQTFAYLKRLGYIVGRHGVPWTTSRKRDHLPGAQTSLNSQSPSNDEVQETTPENVYDLEPGNIADDSVGEVDSSGKSTASPESEEEMQQTEASVSSSEVIRSDFPRADEEDLPMEGTASSTLVDYGSQEEMQGVLANVSTLKTGSAADCSDILQNFSYLTLNQEEHSCETLPMYDVFLPNGRFKKSSPGLPAFRLCISSGQPPKQSDIRALELKSGDAPNKFAFVESGHVSIFSFDSVPLPDLP